MREITVALDQGFYQSPSLPFAAQECVDMVPIASESPVSTNSGYLKTPPGWDLLVDVAEVTGAWLGLWEFADVLYGIGETNTGKASLYSITEAGVATRIGALDAITTTGNTGRIWMDDNEETIAIVVPGVESWFYDATNGLVKITDATFQTWEADAGGVTSVVHIDGYFVFSTDVRMFHSSTVATNMGQNFTATDELEPFLNQKLVQVGKLNGELVACGDEQIKMYRNTANSGFAFSEIPSATIQKGVAYRRAWIDFDNSAFFWGGGKRETDAAWRVTGYGSVTKISTEAVTSYVRDNYNGYSSAVTTAYSFDDQLLMGFGFGGTGGLWFNITASALKGYPVWFRTTDIKFTPHAKAYDKIYQPGGGGKIGPMNMGVSTDFGEAARSPVFSAPYLQGNGNNLEIAEIELLAESGSTIATWDQTASFDPQVTLEYSRDEGRTWVSKGARSMGKAGKYKTNVKWHRLGLFDDRAIFRFSLDTANTNAHAFTGVKFRVMEGI